MQAARQPAPVATVPIRVEAGLTVFDATINGVAATFVFDTGAPAITLDQSGESRQLGWRGFHAGRVR